MTHSKLDSIYRSILFSKYFTKGWGSPEHLKKLLEFRRFLSCRELCYQLVSGDYHVTITKDKYVDETRIIEGYFRSPFEVHMPTLLPEESKDAYFQAILPRKWESNDYKPICIHIAGTGDHYFWRRRHLMAKPLLREAGIGSIILENPFYGLRKPIYQARSALHNVSDIFVMGGCLILEGLVLLQWCRRQGFGPLGVSGLSMGGHMASLIATNWPYPLVLVPCLSSSTASGVFTEGVMSKAINWDTLQCQYRENEAFRTEFQNMLQIQESDAFKAGKELVKQSPDKILQIKDKAQSLTELSKPVAQSQHDLLLRRAGRTNSKRGKVQLITKNIIKIMKNRSFNIEEKSQILKSLEARSSPFHDGDTSNKEDAINFMKGIMDEFTHLKNFSKPVDTSVIISVCASDDGYVPRHGICGLEEIWPGAQVRFIDAGHISAFVLHQKEFRQVIIEAYERFKLKYPGSESWKIFDDGNPLPPKCNSATTFQHKRPERSP